MQTDRYKNELNNTDYSNKTAEIISHLFANEKPKAFVHTFGCQQNVSDGEKIKGILETLGYEITEDMQSADFILYNTCAVREHAELKVFGYVGKLKQLKEKNNRLIIAVCGCMPQQETISEKFRRSYPYVSLVFGTGLIHRLPEFIYRLLNGEKRVFEFGKEKADIIEGLPVHRDKTFKAWLPIMYGCNNFCTYCIVPHVRGREVSRKSADIIAEAKELIASGCKEITLLGQNVNSYNSGEGISFAELLRMINDLDGDFIIRFMTSHPKDCSFELIDTIADCEKVAKQLHLPVQSGNDRVLSAMNRRYTRETYSELIQYAKQRMPDLSITSDIIVGFPGEIKEEFLDTVSLVKEVGYSSLFTFIYSRRTGTPAAEMPDNISREEKGEWFDILLKAQEEKSAEYTSSMLGKTYRVLVDGKNEKNGLLTARTSGNILTELEGDESLIGQFVNVKIVSALTFVVKGEIIK